LILGIWKIQMITQTRVSVPRRGFSALIPGLVAGPVAGIGLFQSPEGDSLL
jgi:hypothetical protein